MIRITLIEITTLPRDRLLDHAPHLAQLISAQPVVPNKGNGSCCARATILLTDRRGLGSGRRNASSHSVSESRHRSSCGLRKCVSRRRASFTSVLCFGSDDRRTEYSERVVS